MEKCQPLSRFAASEPCAPFKWNKVSDGWLLDKALQIGLNDRCACLAIGLININQHHEILTNYDETHHLRLFLFSSL